MCKGLEFRAVFGHHFTYSGSLRVCRFEWFRLQGLGRRVVRLRL